MNATANRNQAPAVAPHDYVTVKAAAIATGLSEGAIRKRIERGIWLENAQWRRAPDGGVWVYLPGITAWIEGTA